MNNQLTVILSEPRGTDSGQRKTVDALAAQLSHWPAVHLVIVPHLYDLAPDGAGMEHLRSVAGDMIVLGWLYPRAAHWVLDANQVRGRMGRTAFFPEEEIETAPPKAARKDVLDRTIWCFDLRSHEDVQPLLAEIERIVVEATGEPVAVPVAALSDAESAASNGKTRIEEATRLRWYPVIDYSRCGNCLECLNFCVFGAFGLDESQQVFVEQPDACKYGCPACSRVCPSRAIMFPQYHDPLVAGEVMPLVGDFKVDLMPLLGAADPRDLAAAERDRALAEQAKSQPPQGVPAAKKDDLDKLVDGLDQSEL